MIEESGENKLAGAVTRVGGGGRSRVEWSGVWARPRAASSWLHTDNMKTPFESSPLATQRGQRGSSMRKAKKLAADELRSEYKRSDFGASVRGKYIERLQTSSNVVVLDPEVADLFPNAAAVNAALRSLAEIAKRAGSRRS